MLAPRPTPKLEDHPPSAVRGCLFNLFTATLHIGGRSSIRNPRTRHAVVTGTHFHGMYPLYQTKICRLMHFSFLLSSTPSTSPTHFVLDVIILRSVRSSLTNLLLPPFSFCLSTVKHPHHLQSLLSEYLHTRTHTHARARARIHTHVHTRMHDKRTHAHTHTQKHARAHMHTRINTHTRTHTHMHTNDKE